MDPFKQSQFDFISRAELFGFIDHHFFSRFIAGNDIALFDLLHPECPWLRRMVMVCQNKGMKQEQSRTEKQQAKRSERIEAEKKVEGSQAGEGDSKPEGRQQLQHPDIEGAKNQSLVHRQIFSRIFSNILGPMPRTSMMSSSFWKGCSFR